MRATRTSLSGERESGGRWHPYSNVAGNLCMQKKTVEGETQCNHSQLA
jgi:hypothetical protein